MCFSLLSIGGGTDPDAGERDGTAAVPERTECKFMGRFQLSLYVCVCPAAAETGVFIKLNSSIFLIN